MLFIYEWMLIDIDLNALFIIIFWGTNYSKVIKLEQIVVLEAESESLKKQFCFEAHCI